jgi:NADPH2:quinone reductase
MVADGELHPEIHAVLMLEETAESIRELAERRVVGKVVITP